jgi:hypothetical protein
MDVVPIERKQLGNIVDFVYDLAKPAHFMDEENSHAGI